MDTREQFAAARGSGSGSGRGLEAREARVRELGRRYGVIAECRYLESGDATWVARRKRSFSSRADPTSRISAAHSDSDEFVLDLVVERKRLDDLASSIKDDRYRRQKFFLKRSGARRLGYLVEGDDRAFERHAGVSEQTIKAVRSAAVQTELWDGFVVIRTRNEVETFDWYARMTAAVADALARLTAADAFDARAAATWSKKPGREDNEEDASEELPEPSVPPTIAAFNANLKCLKQNASSLKTTWGTMLMQVTGVGPEAAHAVIDEYPTPDALDRAYRRVGLGDEAANLLATIALGQGRTVGPVASKRVYASLFGYPL